MTARIARRGARQRDVVGDRQPERQPFVLAVLAEQADALREPRRTAARRASQTRRHAHPPAAHRVETEHRAQQLGAARRRPGRRCRGSRRGAAPAAARSGSRVPDSLVQLEHRLAGLVRHVADRRVDAAADHAPRSRGSMAVFAVPAHRRGPRSARRAAPCSGRRPPHLLEEMADVDDRDAARAQPTDHLEQPLASRGCESELVGSSITSTRASPASARAISTSCRGAGRQRADDAVGRELRVRSSQASARSHSRAHAPRDRRRRTARGSRPSRMFSAHGQVRAERELLVDHRDAARGGLRAGRGA